MYVDSKSNSFKKELQNDFIFLGIIKMNTLKEILEYNLGGLNEE